MIELDLHGASADDLTRNLNRLIELGIDDLGEARLGGGAALAMHWRHRRGTVFNLSVPTRSLRGMLKGRSNSIHRSLGDMKDAGMITDFDLSPFRFHSPFIGWRDRDGSTMGLAGRDSHIPQSDPTHKERVTGIPLAAIEDILRSKLIKIAQDSPRLLAGDGYDQCIAHEKDPRALNNALRGVSRGLRDQLISLVGLIQERTSPIIEGRPPINPINPALARDPWRRFAEIAKDHLDCNKGPRTPDQWQGEWWQNPEFNNCSEEIIGWYLAKNLSGSPRKISEEEFIEWAEIGHAPDEEAKHHLCEALGDLIGYEILWILRDGRTHPENIMKLIVDCEADWGCWGDTLSTFYPHLAGNPRKASRKDWFEDD